MYARRDPRGAALGCSSTPSRKVHSRGPFCELVATPCRLKAELTNLTLTTFFLSL